MLVVPRPDEEREVEVERGGRHGEIVGGDQLAAAAQRRAELGPALGDGTPKSINGTRSKSAVIFAFLADAPSGVSARSTPTTNSA